MVAARHVLPVTGRPLRDGAVLLAGDRIVAVGAREAIVTQAGDGAAVTDLGEAALLPGLVNAHVHLELSWMGGAEPPAGGWIAWLEDLLERRDAVTAAQSEAAAEAAIAAMEARGTVAVGEVTNTGFTALPLARSRLHAVVFLEVLGFKPGDAEGALRQAAVRLDALESDPDVRAAGPRLRLALTAHAPYSVSSPLLKALAGRAAAAAAPLSIHVAESEAELAFIQGQGGPLRDLLIRRGRWDGNGALLGHPAASGPVELLDRLGALSPRTLAVHAVHLGARDFPRLQARGVTVVTCPRSNRRLQVGVAQVPRLLSSGIPVALGTDSLASAPDLDLFAEMAALRQEHPGLAPAAVLRMGTLNGARALGLEESFGSIAPGKSARLLQVPVPPGEDPLEVVTGSPDTVAWIPA
ncbi:MAG TPA: amidohydrolase family protein [Candidatus Polarisedimenticolaceae bacterium]|nr:amidohydrolase family protein [Candidatus Polarisedimenticolaceae bacterium]